MRNRLGLGSPTENPFFADIYTPSHVNPDQRLPVRVFIHGGFMQFGSTSGQFYNQQFFSAEHFGEIRVLLGHRYVNLSRPG
jgi:carboxylesterase type B